MLRERGSSASRAANASLKSEPVPCLPSVFASSIRLFSGKWLESGRPQEEPGLLWRPYSAAARLRGDTEAFRSLQSSGSSIGS